MAEHEQPTIVITLQGGLIDIETKTPGVVVLIKDFDAAEEDPEGRELQYEPNGEIYAAKRYPSGSTVTDFNYRD